MHPRALITRALPMALLLAAAACSSGASGDDSGVTAGGPTTTVPSTAPSVADTTTSTPAPPPPPVAAITFSGIDPAVERVQVTIPAAVATSFPSDNFTIDAFVGGPETGEAVIFLHGFPETAYAFRHQLNTLAAEGYRVIAFDQRGISPGARPTSVADYDMVLLADDVLAVADALGVDSFHLVGHDQGGAVAWNVAVTAPQRLLSLSVIGTPHPSAYAEANQQGGETARKGGLSLVLSDEDGSRFLIDNDYAGLKITWSEAGLTPEESEVYRLQLQNEAAIEAALLWYKANDLREAETDLVRVPAMLIYPERDCCFGRDAADLTQDHVTAPFRLEVLPGVNHWAPETAPDQVTDFLRDHMVKDKVVVTTTTF